ncbi:MAG: hypothetical protein KDD45_12320 [Bdellovibrionales bacterium]|nr:hypothetical protein [Bdellovibrionales bacterium]
MSESINKVFNAWFDSQNLIHFELKSEPELVNISLFPYKRIEIASLFQERDFIDITEPLSNYQTPIPEHPIKLRSEYDLWNNEYYIPVDYSENDYSVQLPDTISVGDCFSCNKDGEIICPDCNGVGSVKCYNCNNSPIPGIISCTNCRGKGCFKCGESGVIRCDCKEGWLSCTDCYMTGTVKCPKCNSTKKVALSTGICARNQYSLLKEEEYEEGRYNKGMQEILGREPNNQIKPIVSFQIDVDSTKDYDSKFPQEVIRTLEKVKKRNKTIISQYVSKDCKHLRTDISYFSIDDLFIVKYKLRDVEYEVLLQESTGFSSFDTSPWQQITSNSLNKIDELFKKRNYKEAMKYINIEYRNSDIPEEVNSKRDIILFRYGARDFFLLLAPYLLFLSALVLTESKDEPPVILVLPIGVLIVYWLKKRHNGRKRWGLEK